MELFILILVFGLLIINTGFKLWLSILNYQNRNQEIPEEVKDIYDIDKYKLWQEYYMENFRFNLLLSVIHFLIIMLLLIFNGFDLFTNFAKAISSSTIFQTLIIVGLYLLIMFIVGIFSSYYQTFKIEEKYGFNKMNVKTFTIDNIKNLILFIVFGGGAAYGLMYLLLNTGQMFLVYAWAAVSATMLFVNLIYTKWIVPIFNKLKPLEDSELKDMINCFSESVGYEVSKISIMDASKRSTKLNAYFSGFSKAKRIVLYDTLVEKMSNEEIVGVLAHEIGHNKHKHIIFNMFQSFVMIALYVIGLGFVLKSSLISEAFGFNEINYGFNFIVYIIILNPILMILNLLLSYISRKFEYQADRFAADKYDGEVFIKSLKVLTRENFSNLTPHPLFVKFYYSHPPVYQRIRAIKKDKI